MANTETEQVLIDRFRTFISGNGDDPTKKRDYLVARMDYLNEPGNNYRTLHTLLTDARKGG